MLLHNVWLTTYESISEITVMCSWSVSDILSKSYLLISTKLWLCLKWEVWVTPFMVLRLCVLGPSLQILIFHFSFRITLLKSTWNPNKVYVFFLSIYKPGEKQHFRTSPSIYEHGVTLHLYQGPLNFFNWVVFSALKKTIFVLFIKPHVCQPCYKLNCEAPISEYSWVSLGIILLTFFLP